MIRLTPPARNKRHKVMFHMNENECVLILGNIQWPDGSPKPGTEAIHKQFVELSEQLAKIRRTWAAHPDAPNHEVAP